MARYTMSGRVRSSTKRPPPTRRRRSSLRRGEVPITRLRVPRFVAAEECRIAEENIMEFGFSSDERAFAQEVREFLRQRPANTFPRDGMDAGYGSGAVSHAFLRALAVRGWLTMGWPRRFGGQERPLMLRL